MVVATTRIRAHELFGDLELTAHAGLRTHDAIPTVAAGVNDTSELHSGSLGESAVVIDGRHVDVRRGRAFGNGARSRL